VIHQRGLLASEVAAILNYRATQAPPSAVLASEKVQRALSRNSSSGANNNDNQDEAAGEVQGPPRNANEDCAICFETLRRGRVQVCSECSNAIHASCLDQLKTHNRGKAPACPLCRSEPFVPQDGKTKRAKGGSDVSKRVREEEGYVNLRGLQKGLRKNRDTSTYKRYGWNDDDY